MTNYTDRLNRPISAPRDLSKTHKRAYIAYVGDDIKYYRTQKAATDAGAKPEMVVPCMVSNAHYDEILD